MINNKSFGRAQDKLQITNYRQYQNNNSKISKSFKNLDIGALGLFGIWCLVLGILCLSFVAPAAAVPSSINYQGLLRDSAGNLVTGTKSMTFKIYDAVTGGTALWTMTSPEVAVSNGLYNVQLGSIASTDLGSGSRWLEVAVGTETLSPRLPILSVAYAITAGKAENVGGYAVGVSGTSIVPTTDATGKLSSLVIPSSGVVMDYATLAGTATDAATVDSIHASTEATANQLLALNGSKQLKAAVTAEADSGYSLFVKSGKIGVATGTNMSAGVSSVPTGTGGATVNCTAVTANSIILLTVGHAASPTDTNQEEGIKISAVSAGVSFTVKTLDGNNSSGAAIPFSYLIIN